MLALADVMNLFTHEFSGLGGCRLSFGLVFPRPL